MIDPDLDETGTFGEICVYMGYTDDQIRCDDADDQPVQVGGLRGLADRPEDGGDHTPPSERTPSEALSEYSTAELIAEHTKTDSLSKVVLGVANLVANPSHGGTSPHMKERQRAAGSHKILPYWAAALFAVMTAVGLTCALVVGLPLVTVALAGFAIVGGVVAWVRVEELAAARADCAETSGHPD